jgi:tRNA threonylcarbamoyladenosine biosynthesis protein TsaB
LKVRVLALDAATEACSVALLDGVPAGGASICSRFELLGRGHAERILAMVDEVLAEAGVGLTMLDGIAASIGPGAFTGVRITVAVAQGLAYGAALRVAAVSTLEALALKALAGGAKGALACLDARMGEVYWGAFVGDSAAGVTAVRAPAVAAPDAVRAPPDRVYHGIGRGFQAHPALSQSAGVVLEAGRELALPDAREVALLGAWRLARGAGLDPAELEPLYLRDKVALTSAERAAG